MRRPLVTEKAMQGYRLFLMQDGHVRSAREFEAADDDAAIARAEELRFGQPAELWSRARLVTKFQANEDA